MTEEPSFVPKVLPTSKVAVCPECYEYVTLIQAQITAQNAGELIPWSFHCARCKQTVEPKMMDVAERLFLNVNKLRKAKKVSE